jgi:mycothiol system anti-sigma-R factor
MKKVPTRLRNAKNCRPGTLSSAELFKERWFNQLTLNGGDPRLNFRLQEAKETKMRCEEAQELITGLVDGELSPQESSIIAAHLGDCANCPRKYSLEESLKRALRAAAMSIHAPSELKEKLLRDQHRSLHRTWISESWQSLFKFARYIPQTALIVALFIVPVLTARYWLASPYFPIVPGIFQSYRQIARGEINPIETNTIPELKQQLMRSVDDKFAPVAYDLSTMNLHLVGRLVQEIANRKVLVAVYEGQGSMLACYTFLGSKEDAPAIAEVLFDREKRMHFYQFFYAQTNAVMHREGQVMCILISQMPMDQLLVIARSKAHVSRTHL